MSAWWIARGKNANTQTLLPSEFFVSKFFPGTDQVAWNVVHKNKNKKSVHRHWVFCSSHTCYLNVSLFIKKNAVKQEAKVSSLGGHRSQLTNMNKTCLRRVRRYTWFKYICRQTLSALHSSRKKNYSPKAWLISCLKQAEPVAVAQGASSFLQSMLGMGMGTELRKNRVFKANSCREFASSRRRSYRFSPVLIIIKARAQIIRAWTLWTWN